MDDIPAYGAPINYGANLQAGVSNLAPLASSWHGAQTGVQMQGTWQQSGAAGNATSSTGGVLSTFTHFLGQTATEGTHLVDDGVKWLGHQAANMAMSPVEFGKSIGDRAVDDYQTYLNSSRQTELNQRLDTLNRSFKSGSISHTQYTSELSNWMQDNTQLSQSESNNMQSMVHDNKQIIATGINTASTITAILTDGIMSKVTDIGAKLASTAIVSGLLDAAWSPAEDALSKIVTTKAFYEALPEAIQKPVAAAFTETAQGAAQTMTAAQITRATAANLALKYPLSFNALSGTGQQIYSELQNAKYGSAVNTMAFNAALLLSGGPIGEAMKYAGKGLSAIKDATFGQTTFLDTLSRNIGDKNPAGLFNALQGNDDAIKSFKALEATNVNAAKGNPGQAAYRVIDGLAQSWGDMGNMTHQDFVDNVMNWKNAQDIVDNYGTQKGLTGITVGRMTKFDADNIAKALTANDMSSKEQALDLWETVKAKQPNAAFANNDNLDQQIKGIIGRNWDNKDSLSKAIKGIKAQFGIKGVSKTITDKLGKMGYTIIKPVKLEAPYLKGEDQSIASRYASKITDSAAKAQGVNPSFIAAVKPLPGLESMGNLLISMGMSPVAAGQRVYDVYNTNFAEELSKTSLVYDGLRGDDLKNQADKINKSLANYVYNLPRSIKSPPVTDYRQLSRTEISEALGITKNEADQVANAMMQASLKVPMSIKGLGNKLVDLNYKLPLTGKYLRYQGAFRYAWNPIYDMKLAIKGEILSQMKSGGQWPTITGMNGILKTVFPEQYGRIDDISSALDKRGMFESGYSNEGADETAAGYKSLGRPGASKTNSGLVSSQKRAVSAMVGTMADKIGMPPEDFINKFPQETHDAIQTVLHYDPNNEFLNSPLARTLNVAFFPFRFNLKVSTAVANVLQRQPAITQFAVIKGMMSASDYLKSPAGQAWYSKNADVIGLLEYFSPVETLSTISSTLGALPGSITQMGELGGLPFGWIQQMLASQGILNTNPPYINPSTGAVSAEYVPVNARGRLQNAISDFIGTLFTYPGKTVGWPSKASITGNIAKGLTGGAATDFTTQTPTNLTPQQQSFQQAVQKLNGQLQIQKQLNNRPPQSQPGQQVPSIGSNATNPLPGKSTSTKKKEAQFAPQALPGQTQLGLVGSFS